MFVQLLFLWIVYFLVNNFYLKRRRLPPGPTPWPFIGNLKDMKADKFEQNVREWHKKYGDIMTIWSGNVPIITLHNSSTIYETFLRDGEAYVGRPANKAMNFARGGDHGIISTEGDLWKDHRRFALHVLRNFGLGKNLMQERVLVEVTAMISDLKELISSGVKNVSVVDEIDRSVGSIINALAFGYRFGPDNRSEFFENKDKIKMMMVININIAWRLMGRLNMDVMKWLPYFSGLYKQVKHNADDIRDFYLKNIEKHRETINFEDDEEPADYVEAFLRHQHKLDKSGDTKHTFTNEQLYGTVFDLWLAGQETSSLTLEWLFLYMIRHPKCQQKVHQELDSIIGSDRILTMEDKNELNYLNAVVNETQRLCNLITFNLPHKTTRNVQINGYDIPAGTIITHQISTILNDDRYFKDPDSFEPERFLDENGRFFSPPEMMQFGIGKRACLGEGLARMELFLFAANILNQFQFKPADGVMPEDTRIMRGTVACVPYKCEIVNRHS